MAIAPIYKCQICDQELDPKSPNSLRQAVVWLKGSTKTVVHIVEEDYRYRHAFCMTKLDYEETLFGDTL